MMRGLFIVSITALVLERASALSYLPILFPTSQSQDVSDSQNDTSPEIVVVEREEIETYPKTVPDCQDEIEAVMWRMQLNMAETQKAMANIKRGWRTIGQYQIYFSEITMDYRTAENYCKVKGGRLVTSAIRDDVARKEIYDFVKERKTSYWVGFNDIEREGVYEWSDGGRLSTYSQLWSPGEPNNNGNQDCGQIWEKYVMLDDFQCDGNIRPICEKSSGWRTIGQYQIYFSDIAMDYRTAENYCNDKGGRLATSAIRDDVAREEIYNIVRERGTSYWVGFNDIRREGRYKWSDGRRLSTHSALWSPKEPNNGGNQDCGQIWEKYVMLDDVQCNQNIKAICEKLPGRA